MGKRDRLAGVLRAVKQKLGHGMALWEKKRDHTGCLRPRE
jgi:hypothetical protein